MVLQIRHIGLCAHYRVGESCGLETSPGRLKRWLLMALKEIVCGLHIRVAAYERR